MVTKIFENKIFEAEPNTVTQAQDSSTDSSVDSSTQNDSNNTNSDNQDNNQANDQNDQDNIEDSKDDVSINQQSNDANTNSNNVLALPPALSMESILKTSGIIGVVRAIGNTIVRRFRKCAKILLRMQNDFISQEGLDVSKILPGSGLVNRLTNFFSGIFKDKDDNTNIGVYSFVSTYIAEVEDDYNTAVNAFNTLSLSNKNESVAGGINSIREFNTVFHLNEDDNDPAAAQNNTPASFDNVVSKGGNLFIVKDGKETKLNVTTESTREICAAVIASFLNKYTNQEKIYKKLGIDTVNEINDKNFNQFMQVLKLYKGATATKDGGVTNANIFGRVKVAYKKMVDSYMRIGQNVINNFSTYAKQAKTKDGKQMSENNANLLMSSSEKLQQQWDRQSDFFVGAFDKIVLLIIQSKPYQNYIDFIMNKVMPVLKSGEAKPEDATMTFTPQDGDEVVLNQTDANGNTKTIVGKVKSYNKETGETEIEPESEVKDASNNVKTEKDGSKTIQNSKEALEDIKDKTPIKVTKDNAIKSSMAKVADNNEEQNSPDDNNADEYYVYEFTGKDDTKYKIIAKGEAQISAETAGNAAQQPEQGNAATGEAARTRTFAPDETLDEDDTQNKDKNVNITELMLSSSNSDKTFNTKIDIDPKANVKNDDILNTIKSSGVTDITDKSSDINNDEKIKEFNSIDNNLNASKTVTSIKDLQDSLVQHIQNDLQAHEIIDDQTLNDKTKAIVEAISYILRINVQEDKADPKKYVYSIYNGISKNDTKYNYTDPSKPNYVHTENSKNMPGKVILFTTNMLCEQYTIVNKDKVVNKCLKVLFRLSPNNDKLFMSVNGKNLDTLCNSMDEIDNICDIAKKKQERLQQNNGSQSGQEKSNESAIIPTSQMLLEGGYTYTATAPTGSTYSPTSTSQGGTTNNNYNQGSTQTPAKVPDASTATQNLNNNSTKQTDSSIDSSAQGQQQARQFSISSQLNQKGISLVENHLLATLKKNITSITVLPDDELKKLTESFGTYLAMSYEHLLNESTSYLAKIKRTVANTNDPLFKNANFYLVSKSAYSDGSHFDTPAYIKESLERTISKNDSYDKLALQAKNESSFNLIPLSESQTYYTSMPVNNAGFNTIGNVLYEAVSLVHFGNNSKIDFVQYLGTNKID